MILNYITYKQFKLLCMYVIIVVVIIIALKAKITYFQYMFMCNGQKKCLLLSEND